MKAITNRIKTAIVQESTWRGIIAILGGFGIAIDPTLSAHIITAVLVLIGSINVAKKD